MLPYLRAYAAYALGLGGVGCMQSVALGAARSIKWT